MSFLEDFQANIEALPNHLRRKYALLRDLDKSLQVCFCLELGVFSETASLPQRYFEWKKELSLAHPDRQLIGVYSQSSWSRPLALYLNTKYYVDKYTSDWRREKKVNFVRFSVAFSIVVLVDRSTTGVQTQNEQRCEKEIEDMVQRIKGGNVTPDSSLIKFSDEALDEQKHAIRIADEKVALASQAYDLVRILGTASSFYIKQTVSFNGHSSFSSIYSRSRSPIFSLLFKLDVDDQVDAHIQQLDQYLKKFDEELRLERDNAAVAGAPTTTENTVKSGRSGEGKGGRKNKIQDVWTPQGWNLLFRRLLNDWEIRVGGRDASLDWRLPWHQLGNRCSTMETPWKHHSDGQCSVNRLYRRELITVAGRKSGPWIAIWKSVAPTKVKCFARLVAVRRACLTHDVMQRKGINIDSRCLLFISMANLQWIMPEHTVDLLSCWIRRGGSNSQKKWWRIVPACIWNNGVLKTLEDFQGLTDAEDKLQSNYKRDGNFSVKTAYLIISNCDHRIDGWPWKPIWKTNALIKVIKKELIISKNFDSHVMYFACKTFRLGLGIQLLLGPLGNNFFCRTRLATAAAATPSGMDLDLPVDPNEPTYCFCNQVSYGEMVACDNPNVNYRKQLKSEIEVKSVHHFSGPHSVGLRWGGSFFRLKVLLKPNWPETLRDKDSPCGNAVEGNMRHTPPKLNPVCAELGGNCY
ncbi:putative serine incorporator-like [Capsicum annuum]|nr:putative serine incorporator-like [Capsicum annuum]